MKKTLLVMLCTGLLASPTYAQEELTFEVEGTFTEEGLLEGGSFEGTLSYDNNTPDTNTGVTNVGVFEVEDFEITILNAQSEEVDTLTDENSQGTISLTGSPTDGEAELYKLSTVPDEFFETGTLIDLTFEYPAGGSPKEAPTSEPGDFIEGRFAPAGGFEGISNPQLVANATITQVDDGSSVSTNENSSLVGLLLVGSAIAAVKLKKKLLPVA